MRKNNLHYLLILSLVAACSESKGPKTLLSKWEKNYEAPKALERALASPLNQGQCLKEVYGLDLVKAQVKELEGNFVKSEKVTGSWKHLDLSTLPVPQANFLKKFGNQIGDLANPDSIDYSSCRDVPCIYNKIYGKEDHIAGYVHYLWYLRMGNMLSADNMVPDQQSKTPGVFNGKVIPLSSYLYNDEELYGFWRLSLMLKAPHSTLSYLTEVQRVPRGESYERPDYKGACGLAHSYGWITLTDGCLWITKGNVDSGYLYTSVTHELTHQLDFQQGRGTQRFYRSHKDDYLEFAAMTLNEYVNESNVLIKQWQLKPDGKYITPYAKTNPQENFAESIAYFRVDGDRTGRDITNEHFNFVSENYYQGRSFKKVDLLKAMLNNYSTETSRLAFQAVMDCSKAEASPTSVYFSGSDFSNPLLPQMLNCIGTRGQEMALSLRAKIAVNEADGCSALNEFPGKSNWDSLVKDHLRSQFDRYLQELNKDKDYLARIEAFYAELKDKAIAREAYINCYGASREESCFNSEIKKLALLKAETLKLPPDQTEDMADMYVSYHSYLTIKEETSQLYVTFLSGQEEKIRSQSLGLWERCSSGAQNDDETPRSGAFQVGTGYMISSMYNCINADFPATLRDILRSFTVDGLKLEHPNEELILTQLVKPQMVKTLTARYEEEREKEVNAALELIAKDDGTYRKQILSDFSWVKNVADQSILMSDCKRAVYTLIDHPEHYTLKKDLFSDLAGKVCSNIQSTPEYQTWLTTSEQYLTDGLMKGLDNKLYARGNARATACMVQYNKRKQREDCFLNGWPAMEELIIAETMRDPVALKFKIPRETLMGRLAMNRKLFQDKIMKEKFN